MSLRAVFLLVGVALLGFSYQTANSSTTDATTRLFAYMDTRNEDGTKKRRHVFALTDEGSLAKRVTTKIDEWREPPEGEERKYYHGRLKFASPTVREETVVRLYNLIVEFNAMAVEYYKRFNETPPEDHLFVMKEEFGPNFPENNQDHPAQEELNALHVQFSEFQGTGVSRDVNILAAIWGNWTARLHDELVHHLGTHTAEEVHNITIASAARSGLFDYSLCVNMTNTLEDINEHIHATEALGSWAVETRFSFNELKLPVFKHENFLEEDFEESKWKLGLEMGGLYLAYAKTGKNLYHLMLDNDFAAIEDKQNIQFQVGFSSVMYVVWIQNGETEAQIKDRFKAWWDENDITGKYGYEWYNPRERNGFVRLGQQVCDPPSDCDRELSDLLDEIAETPIVEDITFSSIRPYGTDDSDLRFLLRRDEQASPETEHDHSEL